MSYFNQLKLDSIFLVTPYILITVALLNFNDSHAQSITRQVISSMGNTQVSTELYLSQTAGQGALVNVSSNEQAELRQGFQQPILLSNGKDRFEVELSIYPNPNNGEFNNRITEFANTRFGSSNQSNTVLTGAVTGVTPFKAVLKGSGLLKTTLHSGTAKLKMETSGTIHSGTTFYVLKIQ